jgi:putative ABC transport system permease protein
MGILQDLRDARRSLTKMGVTSLAVTATIALGIGVNGAIFGVAHTLLRELPFGRSEQLVAVSNEHVLSRTPVRASWHDLEQLRVQAHLFESAALYHYNSDSWASSVQPGGASRHVAAVGVSEGFFATLRARPLVGRLLSKEDHQPPSTGSGQLILPVVISHAFWTSYFGGRADVIGQKLALDGAPAVVAGVMTAEFRLARNGEAEVFFPYWTVSDPQMHDYNWRFFDIVARLSSNLTIEQARARLRVFSEQRERDDPRAERGLVVRLESLHEALFGSYRAPFPLLFGAAGLLLLITCASVANLLLARGAGRERDLSVRSALGASRWRILRPLLLESGLLAFSGGVLGLLVCRTCLASFNAFAEQAGMQLEPAVVDVSVLGATLLLVALTGALFGLVPAIQLSRATGASALTLRAGGGSSAALPTSRRLTRLLVSAEVGLSLALLVGMGLLVESLWRLTEQPLGFRPEGVETLLVGRPTFDGSPSYAERQAVIWPQALDRILDLPGIEAAGWSEDFPLSSHERQPWVVQIRVEGRELPSPGYLTVEGQEVTGGYFAAMGVPLLRGRAIGSNLPTRPHAQLQEAVISASFARDLWPQEDPVGRTLSLGPRRYTIVGVAGDVKQRGARAEAPARFFYTPLRYGDFSDYDARFLVVRTHGPVADVLAGLRDVLRQLGPDVTVLRARSLQEAVENSAAWDRLKTGVLVVFGALALMLALIGVYGTVARNASARRRELGIRLALGSPAHDVVRLVMREALSAAVVGMIGGLVVAWFGARLLASQLYGVSPSDPVVYAFVACALFAATLAACYAPARRATAGDPMKTLRCE